MKRIEALKRVSFEKGEVDGFLVFNSANLTWLTGFSGASALLIPKHGEIKVYVYGVNYAHAEAELGGFMVELVKRGEDLMVKIAKQAAASEIRKLAVDALNVESWRALVKALGGEKKVE